MIGIWEIVKSKQFRLPILITLLIAAGLIFRVNIIYIAAIVIGLLRLGWETIQKLRAKRYSLDYIAILAMATALWAHQYIAGAIIALMIVVSESLEEYGSARAEKTLRELVEKMPKTAMVKEDGQFYPKPLQEVKEGQIILVRPNELLPLDGTLVSGKGLVSEANLTGEMEPVLYKKHDYLKSGFINVGESMEMMVVGDFSGSTYQKIINLVKESNAHPARIVGLAEKYNYLFTGVTLVMAFGAYYFTRDASHFLAVLVIATPCPLLIATPIAMIGGLNKAARKGIIVKKPSVIEILHKVRTIFFDKTGTLTLGEPVLKRVVMLDDKILENHAIVIAAGIEFHSIHPIARSLVKERERRGLEHAQATDVKEKIGEGITGTVAKRRYHLRKSATRSHDGIEIDLLEEGRPLAKFIFDDQLKGNVTKLFDFLKLRGYTFGILTGDKQENAERIFSGFNIPIIAESSPEKKTKIVQEHQARKQLVALVGDGLNDAPALALADVGIVFSGTENSASIEAADIAVLAHDVDLIREAIEISQNSYRVALQSILVGIGLSFIGMIFAAFGFIRPIEGAVLQEVIDILVIFNSLRATY